jgi:hypothetical protein
VQRANPACEHTRLFFVQLRVLKFLIVLLILTKVIVVIAVGGLLSSAL